MSADPLGVPKLRAEFRGKHEIGSQPFECAAAYEMGRQCPAGRELDLFLGLDSFWPGMARYEAFDYLLQGLADRGIHSSAGS